MFDIFHVIKSFGKSKEEDFGWAVELKNQAVVSLCKPGIIIYLWLKSFTTIYTTQLKKNNKTK
jgi:hypothetical protein